MRKLKQGMAGLLVMALLCSMSGISVLAETAAAETESIAPLSETEIEESTEIGLSETGDTKSTESTEIESTEDKKPESENTEHAGDGSEVQDESVPPVKEPDTENTETESGEPETQKPENATPETETQKPEEPKETESTETEEPETQKPENATPEIETQKPEETTETESTETEEPETQKPENITPDTETQKPEETTESTETEEPEIKKPDTEETERIEPDTENTPEHSVEEDSETEDPEETKKPQKKPTRNTTGEFTYTLSGKDATITGYSGTSSSVIVPETVDGYTVTGIGNRAFIDCSELTSLVLPESVRSLGYEIIRGTGITSITIPKNVTSSSYSSYSSSPNGALAGCTTLTEVVFEPGMTKIPSYIMASNDYTSYVTKVTIPDTVTSVGGCAFYNCDGISSIKLPENLTVIGSYAFENCDNLKQIDVPKKIKGIEYGAFQNCTRLESVNFNYNPTVEYTADIDDYAFRGCTSLTSVNLSENIISLGYEVFADCSALINLTLPESMRSLGYRMIRGTGITSITIPKNVTSSSYSGYSSSPNGALAGCTTLTEVVFEPGMTKIPSYIMASNDYTSYVTKVTIPDTVTSVGGCAFYNCDGISSIKLPENLTVIGSYAFENCDNLKQIDVPKKIKGIEYGAFQNCTRLESVNFNYNPTVEYTADIDDYAFRGCTSLTSVNLSENIISLGYEVFADCSALINLTLPESMRSLGYRMIRGTGITSITIPKNVTSSSYSGYSSSPNGALAGCTTLTEVVFEPGMTKIPSYIMASNDYTSYVTKVTIPDTVTSVGGCAFYNCDGISSIKLPENLTVIGSYAFENCDNLKQIDVPKKIKGIEYGAFQNCTRLESVNFNYNPTVEYTADIDDYAFRGCTSLTSVNLSENIISLGYEVFADCSALINLTLPESMRSLGYRMIRGTGITSITIPKNVTSSSYSGYSSSPNGALAGCTTLTEVVFEPGMTKIPSYIMASNDYTSYVTKVTIPDTVTSVGGCAFYNCDGISSIKLPENLTVIGSYAFENCDNLKQIDVPKKIKGIEYGAFQNCTRLESVNFNYNSTVEYTADIDDYAFRGCTSLTSVNLSENIISLGYEVFADCSALTNLTLPESMRSLGYRMIRGTGITSITIPKNVTSSNSSGSNGALAGCTTLTEVVFEPGMTKIPSYIMASGDYTSYVTKVIIPASVTSIGNYAFYNCNKMTIYGTLNSYAQTYASENNIPFVSVAISKDAVAEEVLSNMDLSKLLGNISIGGAEIKGPSIKMGKKEFELFSIDAAVNLKLSDKVQAKVDTGKKTIQVLVGFDKFSGSADISADKNSSAYWSESYQEVKSLYMGVTGKKVDTTQLWNRFSKLRGRLKKMNCSMGLDASASVAGYIEFSYASGEIVYSEGGLILEAALGASMEYKLPPCPAVYMTFGAKGKFNGNVKLVREDVMTYMPSLKAAIELSAKLGAGVGSKKIKTYAEGGFIGALQLGMEVPKETLEEALSARLSAQVYFESEVIGFDGPSYGPQEFASYPIYPRYTQVRLFDGQDVTEFDPAAAELSPRTYLQGSGIAVQSLVSDGVSFEKDDLYRHCAPQLAELSDGTKILVWVDDDGTKTDINKTSLKYSIYDGSAWGDVETLDARGGMNDYPSVYSDGKTVTLVWQSAPQMGEDATLADLLPQVELYYAVWKDGVMGTPEQLTDQNSAYEMLQTVTSNGNKTAVAWVENSENDPFQSEGTVSIKVREYADGTWTEKTAASGLSGVSELILCYNGDTLTTLYETEEENANIVILSGTGKKAVSGYGMVLSGRTLYYNTEQGMMEYDLASGMTDRIGIASLGGYEVLDNGTEKMILTTIYDGFTSELAAYKFDPQTGIWSDPVTLTDEKKYIRSYSALLDQEGRLTAACNFVDVDQNSDNIYGKAKMSVYDYTEQTDLAVGEEVYYELESAVSGASLPLHFFVTNNGLSEITSFDVTLSDENGNELQTGRITCRIAPGEKVETSYNYELPDSLTAHTVFIKAVGEGETKLDDNTASVKIGSADIAVGNLHLSGNNTDASLEGVVHNIGCADADNVTVSVYDTNEEGVLIQTVSLGTIASGAEGSFTVSVPESSMDVNPLASGNTLYVKAETSSEEMRFDNNSELFLVKSETDQPISLNYETLDLQKGETKKLEVTYGSLVSDTVQTEWTSSNESVVTVSDGVVTAVNAGTAQIMAEIENTQAVCTVTVLDGIAVTDIYLEETAVTLQAGEAKALTAKVLPSNAENKKVTWETADATVAVVSSTGVVSGMSAGKTTVTAVSEDGYKTAVCTVTVSQKEGQIYTVNFSGGSGTTGMKPKTLTGTARTIVTLPENPYTKDRMIFVGWSDGTNVYDAGALYRIPYRNVTLTAQWKDDGKKEFIISASCQAGGTITPAGSISVLEGTSKTFTITPSEGYVIADVQVDGTSVGAKTSYTFENISSEHRIEASFRKKSDTADTAKKKQTITGTTSYQKKAGDAVFALDAKLTEGNGTLSYISSDTSVIRVDNTGTIIIMGEGTAIVTVSASETAEYAAASMQITITVSKGNTGNTDNSGNTGGGNNSGNTGGNTGNSGNNSGGGNTGNNSGNTGNNDNTGGGTDKPSHPADTTPQKITKISFAKKSITLKKRKSTTLTAAITPSNAANKKLTWKSSNTKVAVVNSSGKVTAKTYGTATITATAKDGSGVKATCKVTVPYTITYKLNKGKNNSKNPTGYYNQKVTLKNPTRKGYAFKGWYTDKKYKKKLTTIKKGTKKNYTLYAKWEKLSVKPTAIVSAKNSKKGQVLLKLKKVSGARGYEVSYTTDPKFKKSVVKKTTAKNAYTIKKLKKGKTYYIKIRAYKVDSAGKKVYGTYTKTKKIRITK